jgi:hypothetical protein
MKFKINVLLIRLSIIVSVWKVYFFLLKWILKKTHQQHV